MGMCPEFFENIKYMKENPHPFSQIRSSGPRLEKGFSLRYN